MRVNFPKTRRFRKISALLLCLTVCMNAVSSAWAVEYEESTPEALQNETLSFEESSPGALQDAAQYFEQPYEEAGTDGVFLSEEVLQENPLSEASPDSGSDFSEMPGDAALFTPVTVIFLPLPENLAVTVTVCEGEAADSSFPVIEPQADGSYLLMPGIYWVDVSCDGYVPIEKMSLTVSGERETEILPFEMTPVLSDESILFPVGDDSASVTVSLSEDASSADAESIAAVSGDEASSGEVIPPEFTASAESDNLSEAEGFSESETVPYFEMSVDGEAVSEAEVFAEDGAVPSDEGFAGAEAPAEPESAAEDGTAPALDGFAGIEAVPEAVSAAFDQVPAEVSEDLPGTVLPEKTDGTGSADEESAVPETLTPELPGAEPESVAAAEGADATEDTDTEKIPVPEIVPAGADTELEASEHAAGDGVSAAGSDAEETGPADDEAAAEPTAVEAETADKFSAEDTDGDAAAVVESVPEEEKRVRVIFLFDAESGRVSVSHDGEDIEPEDDGSFLLLPGIYSCRFHDETGAFADLKKNFSVSEEEALTITLAPESASEEGFAAPELHSNEELSVPTLLSSPSDNCVIAGEQAVFSVNASGSSLSYRWQVSKDSGVNWYNSGISTATAATLRFTCTQVHNGLMYRCAVSNAAGTVYSDAAALTVYGVPSITLQPTDCTVYAGGTASFSVTAEGEGLSYRWQVSKDSGGNWYNSGISTAAAATLYFTCGDTHNGLLYRCAVSNAAGTVYSDAAALTVYGVPSITLQPTDCTVYAESTASFSVTAEGEGLSYRWQVSKDSGSSWYNSGISTASSATLSFTCSETHDGLQYRCAVSNNAGTVISDPAALTVTIPSPTYRALLVGEVHFSFETANRNQGDVNLMANMLSSITGPDGGKYSINQKIDLSSSGVQSAIQSTFAAADEDDVSLFFMATHGVTNLYDGTYAGALLTTSDEYIALEDLASWLSAVPGKVIVILGSCGSGAAVYQEGITENSVTFYSNGTDDGAAFTQAVIDVFSAYDSTAGVSGSNSDVFYSNTGEFRTSKFYVLTATRHQETSYGQEGSTPYNYFTKAIADAAGVTMPADTNGDSCISLHELFVFVYQQAMGPYDDGTGEYYQHAQEYPKNSSYKLFAR